MVIAVWDWTGSRVEAGRSMCEASNLLENRASRGMGAREIGKAWRGYFGVRVGQIG